MIKPDWVTAYTTREHLLLDLDNTTLFKVLFLVRLIMKEYPKVGDCLILLSSSPIMKEWVRYPPCNTPEIDVRRHNYHAVFSGITDYEYSCHIIETLAGLGTMNPDYVNIRHMRQDMTLRTSCTVNHDSVKPKPQIITYLRNRAINCHDTGIQKYMKLFRLCH